MGDYIDLDFFQSYTRTTYGATTTPTATFVNTLIDDSEQEIDEYTGRSWGQTTYPDELHDEPLANILLKNTPVLSVTSVEKKDGTVLTEGIDEDYIVDGDFIIFNKDKSRPDRVLVTYSAGYNPVRADVKMLTTLLTLSKIIQSESATADNTESISVGPISITSRLGLSSTINIEKDIEKYKRRLRRIVR